MAELKSISLPHGTIPTQMFGNVNLQNAIMYVNENFSEVKNGVNDAISATNETLKEKANLDHDHDDNYASANHTHGMSEITGLNSALDDKADLNHEHSQYLSSLPAHYHDVNGIQGLGEQLQSKSDKVHSHSISQVENLPTELGIRASTSYVDQQISSVSSSIKTIADQEIEDYGALKNGESGSASEDVPKDIVAAPSNETVEQKNARVGTRKKWARADHKHAFSSSMGDAPIDNRNASTGADTENTILFTNWSSGHENGLKIRLYALIDSTYYSGVHIFQPVDIEIASNGIVKSVSMPTGNKGILVSA